MQYFPQIILKFVRKSPKIIIILFNSSNIFLNFPKIFLRYYWNFSKNFQKLHRKFPGKFSPNSLIFLNIFNSIFTQVFLTFTFCKISPKFSKKYWNIFPYYISKFCQNLWNTNFYTAMFLQFFQNFYTIVNN